MEEREISIKIEGLRKKYRLGTIGGGTLRGDLQSWWARKRGIEDPNSKVGSKVYDKNEIFYALDGIDLTIYKGERIGIIGHNGAGKSTLLKLLSRVTAPTEGIIYLNGRIASMLEVGTGFNPELTGRENIYLNGAILGMTKAEVEKKIEQIIDFSEVRQFIDTPVKRYSSGMYVKLAFSVSAHLDSEIMIMDEVLAVGDMTFQKKCLSKMKNVSLDEGRTVLYVSHNMNTIRQLCERCIVMDHGRIVYSGDVEEAIQIYMGYNSDCIYYDFEKEREITNVTGIIRLNSLQLVDMNDKIMFGSHLVFRIDYSSEESINQLFFRFCINLKDGTPIATSVSQCFLAETGENSKTFDLDISQLAPGQYVIKIIAIELSELGTQVRHDRINRAVGFEVYSKNQLHNFVWDAKWWGHYVIPDAKVFNCPR